MVNEVSQSRAPLSPAEARDAMIRGIRRRLVGPESNDTTDREWPGPPTLVEHVHAHYVPPNSYPYGPWETPAGEEVLPQTPLFLYPIATLAPKMTDAAVADIQDAAESVLDDAATDEQRGGQDPLLDVTEVGNMKAEQDDAADDHEVFRVLGDEAHSVGVSIRVPSTCEEVRIRLTGGVYTELLLEGQVRPWWKRSDASHEVILPLEASAIAPVAFGHVTVTLGVDVRIQQDGSRIVTCWARNAGQASSLADATAKTLFQTRLEVFAPTILAYEADDGPQATPLDLLYSNVALESVGHGCDSIVHQVDGVYRAATVFLPVVNLPGLTPDINGPDGMSYAIGMLDLAEMNASATSAVDRMITDYGAWITERRREIPSLAPRFVAPATVNIADCERFLEDISRGWDLVGRDPMVRQALCDASRAMNSQRIAYNAGLRTSTVDSEGNVTVEGSSPHVVQPSVTDQARWRPFQLAFILASLDKIVSDDIERRTEVDVVWMPTGGGKTEAYLGLSAFSILWEKATQTLRGTPDVRNTKVFMRYTLRLLTVQQITRAASLICALELIRREHADRYGTAEIRIGAWLGSKVTANKRKDAVTRYREAISAEEPLPFILRRCPWCGAAMGATSRHPNRAVGYSEIDAPGNTRRIHVACPDGSCPFSDATIQRDGREIRLGIPLFEVDEDLYAARPDFVVGTIDKVARMGWVPESQLLFGLRNGQRIAPPPTLFIQDELHLIAGPLGSIDGPFEAALEHLCEVHGGSAPVIVAATATTKNFQNHVAGLYARNSRVVPPPGLVIEDSFFAREDLSSVGKTYVGVCSSSGFSGSSSLQTLVLALLAHQAAAVEDVPGEPDPYWSNVVFFSSRRSLGMLTSAVESTFRSNLNLMHALSGIKTGSKDSAGKRHNTRSVGRVRELTATSSEDVSQVLEDLGVARHDQSSISLCFATSMVEVGLDVPRLGLMTVMSQPKSASQYIQVTGRVGRSNEAPGLVVTVLNSRTARDRAHYEDFTHWHRRLYSSVESASVTPYTTRALQRSLASVLVMMCRILGRGSNPQAVINDYWDTAIDVFARRASNFGPGATAALNQVMHELLTSVSQPAVATMKWTSEDNGTESPFIYPIGAIPPDKALDPSWQILNSMRSVDQDANVKAMAGGGAAEGSPPGPTGVMHSDGDPALGDI